jgi:hypothetical protein
MWGAVSDERTGLSFTTAAGPRQLNHCRVRVPWDRDHILLSQIRDFPFVSPPTTRMATVEVFDPASARKAQETPPNNSVIASRRYRTAHVENTASKLLHYCVLRMCCLAMDVV